LRAVPEGTPFAPRLRPLGSTGLSVTALGLGTAALAVAYGAPGSERGAPDPAQAVRTIEAALDAGIGLIDTAPAYGEAETLVGAALAGGGAQVCVATKLAIPPQGWEALDAPAVHAAVRRSAEASLRALGRDRLDVLAIHNATAALLGEDALVAALLSLRAEGLVGALGATVYGEDNALAAIGCPAIEVVQVAHSALDRRTEARVIPRAAREGVGIVTRSVLLRGVLSPAGARLRGDADFSPLYAAADAFRAAAGVDWDGLPGAAVAFAASRPGIASVLLGPRDAAELADLLDGAARATAARAVDVDELVELPPALLDPSRWPAS
jgi:aryl-alcohol dehydrogenase-like predicted oxidoreductase